MTTYRLPEVLGGGEVEATESWSGCAGAQPEYLVAGITITMPPGVPLEPVKPPLPAEPTTPGAVVQIQLSDPFVVPGNVLFQRFEAGWTEPGRDADAADFQYFTWARVCSYGTPVLLVPAPPVVELPWVSEPSIGKRVSVHRLGGGPVVSIEDADGTYPTTCHVNAKQMIAALTAADEAERRNDA